MNDKTWLADSKKKIMLGWIFMDGSIEDCFCSRDVSSFVLSFDGYVVGCFRGTSLDGANEISSKRNQPTDRQTELETSVLPSSLGPSHITAPVT